MSEPAKAEPFVWHDAVKRPRGDPSYYEPNGETKRALRELSRCRSIEEFAKLRHAWMFQ